MSDILATLERQWDADESRTNLMHYCDLAAQEIRKLRKASEWQPIETAPKDGTPILAYALTVVGRRILVVRWREAFVNKPDWRDDGGHNRFPTHWMPLPEPPKDTR